MRLRQVMAAMCLAGLVVSCSSDADGTDLGLDTAPTTTAAPPATTEQPETTSAPTTAAPTTSTTTTTEPPPTVAETTAPPDPATTSPATHEPTTTVPVELSAEDKVRADYEAARLAREHCTYDPFSCDYASIAIPGSPMDVQTRQVVQSRIENNLRAVEGKGEVKLRVDSVGYEGESAFVTICVYDTVIIYDIADPTSPDDDIIYNEEKNSYRVRWELRQQDGRWLLYYGERFEETKGGDLCGF